MSKYTILYNIFQEEIYNLIIEYDGGIKLEKKNVIEELNNINDKKRIVILTRECKKNYKHFLPIDNFYKDHISKYVKQKKPDFLIIEYEKYKCSTFIRYIYESNNNLFNIMKNGTKYLKIKKDLNNYYSHYVIQ